MDKILTHITTFQIKTHMQDCHCKLITSNLLILQGTSFEKNTKFKDSWKRFLQTSPPFKLKHTYKMLDFIILHSIRVIYVLLLL
jgi:hypothetical protein